MFPCSYAKEPFDLRLMILRIFKKLWLVVLITLAGAAVFGGGYYIKNVVMQEELYGITSIYHVAYNMDPVTGNEYTYINNASWDTWVHTDVFLEDFAKNLEQICKEEGRKLPQLTREELGSYISASLPTDLRMPYSIVTTPDPGLSVVLARAAEQSFVDFGEKQREIEYIEVVDSPQTAERVVEDVRPLRALILSGVLTLFLTVIVMMLGENSAESIWLPVTLTRRFGLKAAGAVGPGGIVRLHKKGKKKDRTFEENIKYLFGEMQRAAVLVTDETVDEGRVLEVLKECSAAHWNLVSGNLPDGTECDGLRSAEGILLVVKAGVHAGSELERVLQYLGTQDISVMAAVLWDADEKLIRRYYFLPYRQ